MKHGLQYGSRDLFKTTDEGCDQRLYAALPLSYASDCDQVEAAGLEPATRGFKACTPIGSRSCFDIESKRPANEVLVRTRFTFIE